MRFPNSPITEAIFDIQVNLPDGFELEKLLTFQEKIKQEFPHTRKQMQIKGSLEFQEGIPSEAVVFPSKQNGYVFSSEDGKRVIQVRMDGFTFSRLKPYESWENFYGEAYKLWEYYRESTCPKEVIRVALRYINRIMIPIENRIELKKYIRTVPEIPDELSVTMADYFMRLVVVHPEYDSAIGIISQTIENQNNQEKNNISLIFDIDVFQEVSLDPNDDIIKIIFEKKLRNFRTEIFFKSITKEAQDLFQ